MCMCVCTVYAHMFMHVYTCSVNIVCMHVSSCMCAWCTCLQCMHVHVCACAHACVHVFAVYVHACKCACTCVHCVHVYICSECMCFCCVHVCICMHMYLCACVQRPVKQVRCPALPHFIFFSWPGFSHRSWSEAGNREAPAICPSPPTCGSAAISDRRSPRLLRWLPGF